MLVFRALNGRSPAPGSARCSSTAAGGQFRYPIGYDAYLMYVRACGPAVPARDRPGRARPRRGRHRAARVRRAQRAARSAGEPLDLDDVPRVAVRRRAVPRCRLHGRGRRRVRGPRERRSTRPATCATRRRSSPSERLPRRPPAGPRHRRPPAVGRLHPQLHEPRCATSSSARPASRPTDVQVAEIYDCFTSTVLMGLEGLGLAERGGAGALVRSGATADGRCR